MCMIDRIRVEVDCASAGMKSSATIRLLVQGKNIFVNYVSLVIDLIQWYRLHIHWIADLGNCIFPTKKTIIGFRNSDPENGMSYWTGPQAEAFDGCLLGLQRHWHENETVVPEELIDPGQRVNAGKMTVTRC